MSGGQRYYGDKVVIACGGKSFPSTGSDGSGYKLAERLGHTIIKPVPALCGIEVEEIALAKRCAGLSLKNVKLSAFLKDKKIGEEFGEVLFTHYGFSGPAVLNISGDISENIDKGKIYLSLNLKPALSYQQLDRRFLREIKDNANKQLKNMMRNFLPSGIIDIFLECTKIDGEKRVNQITAKERKKIIDTLFNFSFNVKRVRPFDDSMVTRGGVSVNEINPMTMESRIVSGLFFAGEVIDIDGKTGGYNLQSSFTTGYIAGVSI
ncbi:MAG: aminoacetone oxidase family FAD-binding enzyme [Candidatus Omnitrophica bacterium]|nr:aminoacetone oxidase family FAD-binding enzyme [Candidatus Omnitrophota bacterium]